MGSVLFRQDTTERETRTKAEERAINGGRGSADRPPATATAREAVRSDRQAGPSVIGAGTEITGEISMRGDFRIEGSIEGSVSTRGEVVISDRGSVKGEIEADIVVIEGRVEGAVRARQAVRLKRGCRVSADLKSPAVELEEGGGFNGRVDMTEGSAAADAVGSAQAEATGSARMDAAGSARTEARAEAKSADES